VWLPVDTVATGPILHHQGTPKTIVLSMQKTTPRVTAAAARAGTLRMLRRTCPATNTGRTSYANPTRRPEPLPPVSDMHALPTYPWRTGHLTAALPHMFVSRWVALALWISATGLVALRAWVRTTASTCGTDGPPAVTTGSE